MLLVAGCATTGPGVSRQEVRAAKDELDVKGFLMAAEHYPLVWEVGDRLIEGLPAEYQDTPHPDLGLALAKIDKPARRAFHYPDNQHGVCIVAVRAGSAGETAGLKPGDIITAIDGHSIRSVNAYLSRLEKVGSGHIAAIRLLRGGAPTELSVKTGSMPMRVLFVISEGRAVNAWAKKDRIVVTNGILRFLESKDELAAVLGHELAHLTGHHRRKEIAVAAIASSIGAVAGIATDVLVPGLGGAVSGTTAALAQAAFSRDFEREADYQGVLHAYRAGFDPRAGIAVWERFALEIPGSLRGDLRNSHPVSPERMVRIRKIVDSLEHDGLEQTIRRYGGEHEASVRPPVPRFA